MNRNKEFRWREVKKYLREKGVYRRHMLQKDKTSHFGNMTSAQFAKIVEVEHGDGYLAVLGIYRRIYG